MSAANPEKSVRFAEMARHVDDGIRALERRALRDAIDAFERAYQVAKEADLGTDAVVGTLRNLALARREAGDYRGAVAAYRLALHTPGITNRQKAAILHGLGIMCLKSRAYCRARVLLTRANALCQHALAQADPASEAAAEMRVERVRITRNLSRTLRALKRYKDAQRLLEQLLADFADLEPSIAPGIHLEMARVALAQGYLHQARGHLDQARAFTPSNHADLEAEARLVEAELLFQSNQHSSALAACARAIDLGVKYYWMDDLHDAYRLLHTMVSRAGPQGLTA